jgi:hypothetical protein
MDVIGDLFAAMGVMVKYPVIAVLPATAFGLAFVRTRSRLARAAAVAWTVYVFYEFGMRLRILCSGDCNIRVDLVIAYPVLIALSIAAIVGIVRRSGTRRTNERNNDQET